MLKNKIAVVTGGGSGIGAEIARLFAENGASVAILDRDATAGTRFAEKLEQYGNKSVFHAVDVTDSDSVRSVMDSVATAFGGIDILVTAAGILREKPFVEMSEADFDQIVDIDLKGVFLACRWAVPHMQTGGGGRVINIASQLGIKGGVGLVHYVAAKAGVIGMTKAMALELAPENILVNAIAPGPVETSLLGELADDGRGTNSRSSLWDVLEHRKKLRPQRYF